MVSKQPVVDVPAMLQGEVGIGSILNRIDMKVGAGEDLTCREAILAVMRDVGVIGKESENTQSHYKFRGIEAVVNGVQPSLLQYGVIVTPRVLESHTGTVEVGSRNTKMGWAEATIEFTWRGPVDEIVTSAVGSAFDSGDKAMPKASSVALRTALTQTLMIRTSDDGGEPDAVTYERSQSYDPVTDPPPDLARIARGDLWDAVKDLGWTPERLDRRFTEDHDGRAIADAEAKELYVFRDALVLEAKLQDAAERRAAVEAAQEGLGGTVRDDVANT